MSFLDRFKPQPGGSTPTRPSAPRRSPRSPTTRSTSACSSELAGARRGRARAAGGASPRIGGVEDCSRSSRGARRTKTCGASSPIGWWRSPSRRRRRDGDAALALDGLDDPKQFATIAKSVAARHGSDRGARTRARRHAASAASRAMRRTRRPRSTPSRASPIPAELLNVALKTDHKDAGLAALERVLRRRAVPADAARHARPAWPTRAKNKSVAKRARAMLQGIEEAEAAQRAALEQWQPARRRPSWHASTRSLAAPPVAGDTRVQLADAEADWLELAGSRNVRGRSGYQRPVRRARHRRARRHRALRRRSRPSAAPRTSARASLRRREAGALRARRSAARRGTPSRRWSRREASGRGCPDRADTERRRRRRRRPARPIRRRLPRSGRAARQPPGHRAGARAARRAVARRRAAPRSAEPVDEAAWTAGGGRVGVSRGDGRRSRRRDRASVSRTPKRKVAQRAAERQARPRSALVRQQVQRVEQLVERAQARAAAEDLTVREADRLTRDLRAAHRRARRALPERERHALVERLKAALGAVGAAAARSARDGRVEALRQRRGAGGADRAAPRRCARNTASNAEGGPAPDDIEKAARDLHEIQERWKQVAEAPRAQAQALWHRYRQAADPIQARAREFFAAALRGAQGQSRSQAGADRAGRGARRLDRLDQDRRRAEEAAAGVAADRRRAAHRHARELEALPRGLRQVLHPPQRRPRRAQGDLVGEPREEGSALRPRRGARDLARLGPGGRRNPTAPERVEGRRPGAAKQVRGASGSASAPRATPSSSGYKRRDEIDLEAKQADREALLAELEALARRRPQPDGAGAHAARICSSACARSAPAGTRPRRSSGTAPIRSASASSTRSSA